LDAYAEASGRNSFRTSIPSPAEIVKMGGS